MNSKGFTFIEVVCVIVLISIVGGMAITGTRFMEHIEFRTKVMEVEQAFNYAREHAVKTGKTYSVPYINDKLYVKQGMNPCNYKIIFDGGTYVSEDSTGKNIMFRGTMAPSKAGTLELVNDRIGKRAEITVRIATGKVTTYIDR